MSDDVYEYVYEMPPFSGGIEMVFEDDANESVYKFMKQWEEAVNSSVTGPSEVVSVNSKEMFLLVYGREPEKEEFRDFVMKYEGEPTPPIWCERVKG